ncbi:unnamed protein product [Adineta steineri]|uniref:Senescence domain-containing protein n=1 Tax=Adineta steineri TaxID=433720 RepID=A0A815W1P4_9BILA|nr:unnamed protein product [Adineta steineri]CAF1656238.1 unnamed protein product [Adineta steineri]
MATLEKLRPTSGVTPASLKRETNEYLQRASNLERNRQYEEASVLYRRVVSIINSREGTPAVDDELISIKRNANQQLLHLSLNKNQTANSNDVYRNMVRDLSSQIPHTNNEQDLADMSQQVFEDPSAFQPIDATANQKESNANVLFELDTGAKLFYLAKDGSIQTTSETLPLTIYEVTEDGEKCGLLKLGSWIYPLHPKVSPAFKTGYDAYIFPNNTSVGEFVGLMFDETISTDTRSFFEDILSKLSVFMAQQGTPTYGESLTARTNNDTNTNAAIIGQDVATAQEDLPYDTTRKTGKVAVALMTGTKFLTKQLATGVGMAENVIGHVSKNVQGKLVPNAEPVKVHKGLHATARGLRSTSEVAVKASGFVVSKIGDMTLGLARTFAPNFGKVQKKTNPDGSIETVKLSGLKGIGHAGLASFGIVYESCENAAKHLATNLANESVNVIKYKFGDDASILTENAAYAVGNTALTAYTVGGLGPKSIAKKVVKQTAKQTVKNAFS